MRVLSLALLLLVVGCKVGPINIPGSHPMWSGGGPAVPSTVATDWDFRDPSGVTGHPDQGPDGTVSFAWHHEVDMLTTDVTIAASTQQLLRVKARMELAAGAPVFHCAEGGEDQTPPAFGVFLEVRNDDLSVLGDGRWWYEANRPALGTLPAEFTIEAPFSNGGGWRNAGGAYARVRMAGFLATLQNIGAVGITYGCVSFAHGVRVDNGTVKFTIVSVEII